MTSLSKTMAQNWRITLGVDILQLLTDSKEIERLIADDEMFSNDNNMPIREVMGRLCLYYTAFADIARRWYIVYGGRI